MKTLRIMTERLELRKLEIADRDDFFAYRSLDQVAEYQSWKPKNPEDATEFILHNAEEPNIPGTWFQAAIVLKSAQHVIGDFGIHFLEDSMQAEIGYTLSPVHWRKGYTSEAARAVMDYLFNNLGMHRVTASVDPDNFQSVKLLENMGMRREACFIKSYYKEGEWRDDHIYAMLRDEWNRPGE